MEIRIFEWEILQLIKIQDSFLLPDPTQYFLHYGRARYEKAKDELLAIKKATLLKQGGVSNSVSFPNQKLPNSVPAWGWE
jgi:hypothetical protein